MMEVRTYCIDQITAIALSDGDLSVSVVPELGGKIASILWRGRELLARNRLRPVTYGCPYADFDASGFDECLPTIGACAYPEGPWQGITVPDHGEVWSIPWSYVVEGTRFRLSVYGVRFPYAFEKTIELRPPHTIRLGYAFTNLSAFPLRFLWSAHPLLAARPGMRIHLPAETRVRVDWSKDSRLGDLLAEHAWPHTRDRQGQAVDLGLIGSRESGYADKLYTTRLSVGWCGAHDPADGLYVVWIFPVEHVPFVGLSINQGGWPVDRPAYFNLGLEPCNGYPDRLDVAIASGDCAVALPGDRLEWHLELRVGRCPDFLSELPHLLEEGLAA
jgi:hypothetical protein